MKEETTLKISTENVDDAIKRLKKRLKSNYIRKTGDCAYCGKRINKNKFISTIMNNYHPDCFLNNLK